MIRYSANITIMMSAARKASKSILRDFGELEKLQVSIKGQNDFVTMADIKAQEIIHYELSRARDNYGFLMEESKNRNKIEDNEFTWIIDPIDGTLNFMNGIPYFAISIALTQKEKLISGVVYDPVHNDFYWAEDGVGAYLNDQRLRVTNKGNLDKSIIALGIPFLGRGNHKEHIKSQEAVMSKVAGLRRFGAASLDLAYVAAGRVDGFWEYGLSPWDVAAGIILVKEAGGLAIGINNKETWDKILADGGSVQDIKELDEDTKEIFKTFKEINQLELVAQAGLRQQYIDQSVSLNLAFPSEATPKWINKVHLEAWKQGIKTLYYMRTESVLRGDIAAKAMEECVACDG